MLPFSALWSTTPDSSSAWQVAIVQSFRQKQEQQHFSGQSTEHHPSALFVGGFEGVEVYLSQTQHICSHHGSSGLVTHEAMQG
jgi:hypothetical protein